MACEKHGYTNNVLCPACDLETVKRHRTSNELTPVFYVDALLTPTGQELIYPKRNFAVVALGDHQKALDRQRAEIELLTRERDVWKAKAVHRGKSASRLRAALGRIASREAEAREIVDQNRWPSTLAIDLAGMARLALSSEPGSAHETSHEWLPNAVGSFTCDCCGSVATSNPAAPCTGRDSTLKASAVRDSIAPNKQCPVCHGFFWLDKFDDHDCFPSKASAPSSGRCPKCGSTDTSPLDLDVVSCAACGHQFARSFEKARGCPYGQADCESTRGGVCVCAVPEKKATVYCSTGPGGVTLEQMTENIEHEVDHYAGAETGTRANAADAARYRWLRAENAKGFAGAARIEIGDRWDDCVVETGHSAEELDKAIDERHAALPVEATCSHGQQLGSYCGDCPSDIAER